MGNGFFMTFVFTLVHLDEEPCTIFASYQSVRD